MTTGELTRCLLLSVFVLFSSFLIQSGVQADPIILSPSMDIWTTSVYSYAPGGGGPGGGLNDDQLRVGGWGDTYLSLLQFNLSGAPTVANSASLVLYDMSSNEGTPVSMNLGQVTSSWDWSTTPITPSSPDNQRLWWVNRPNSTQLNASPLPAPSVGSYYSIDITNLYNQWQSGAAPNYGIQLSPTGVNKQWDYFASSENPTAAWRPTLVIDPAVVTLPPPTTGPNFQFPLKGTDPVYLTTQAGGLSSDNSPGTYCQVTIGPVYLDPCHQPNKAYYALDFTSPNATVVAANGGEIIQLFGQNGITGAANKCDIENCVVIKDSNGLYTEYREFTSLGNNADGTPFYVGETIPAGADLGTLRSGQHLHFQVEALVNGQLNSKSCDYVPDNCSPALANVTVGNRLIKDYRLSGDGQIIKYNPDGSVDLSNVIGTPEKAQIYGQTLPVLATTQDPNSKAYNFNVVVGELAAGMSQPIYIDPLLAIGYDYQVLSGPNFASVILPNVGDGEFALWLWNNILGDWVFDETLTHDNQYFFASSGVDRFRILGIETGAGLDPNDPQAFVTGLTFIGNGVVDLTMTPITVNAPEPADLALFVIGLAGLGFSRRKRAN